LRSLEVVLESFLDRAVALKENRLRVLSGINRLDDIARQFDSSPDITDRVGGWFAEHNRWLEDRVLRPADRQRIGDILDHIREGLQLDESATPAARKIAAEINRWAPQPTAPTGTLPPKLILKRGAEQTAPSQSETITKYADTLKRLNALFADVSGNKMHLMSALDDALRSAYEQRSRDALLLAAGIVYYLKINGYKVEPFVQRLKRAEKLLTGGPRA
jgi:hypothetical protein